jgi:hypothetical protein
MEYVFYHSDMDQLVILNGNYMPGQKYSLEISGIKLGALVCIGKL